ncbi:hypothetical protein SH611_01325 [Geminicoccaceae bacterium 1502E]|nr:hypothetical protein [Geminicoccaceae bacterium 1502E]
MRIRERKPEDDPRLVELWQDAVRATHAFHRKCGFATVGRSEVDGAGRPFPLIHMAQPA